jgi:hypothetical protein
MLHIRCGDDMRPAFEASGLPGRFLRWADPVCQGPTPAGLDHDAWREARASYAAAAYDEPLEGAYRYLDEQDAGLATALEEDEVVLWFEHDLFDQTVLIYLLDWFARHLPLKPRLTLICIDRYPGIEPFYGIGQLEPEHLAALFETRKPVTAGQFEAAVRAWAAYRSPDPLAIESFLKDDQDNALPFLDAALLRHLEEFPSTINGLGRSEQQAVMSVADEPMSASDLFRMNQRLEDAPWCGDRMYWHYLKRLAGAHMPALAIEGPDDWWKSREGVRESQVGLTRTGFALLRRAADWVSVNGIDRWIGGVHLQGRTAAWRWDAGERKLVRAGNA